MFEPLLAAGIAAAIVWWLLRQQSTAASQEGASAKEIERLRATVEELSTALEQRAEAVDRKLSATIEEARTVHGLLDRTLSAVGAQIVRTEAHAFGRTSSSAEMQPDGRLESMPPPANAVAERPSAERMPRTEEPPDELSDSAFIETGIPAFLTKAESLPDGPEAEPIVEAAAYDKASTEVAGRNNGILLPQATNEPPMEAELEEKPTIDRETEREERVIALVASGVTDSVDIARQTGLTRGEVELIMILHGRGQAPAAGGGEAGDGADSQAPVEPGGVLLGQAGDDRYSAIYALIASGVTDPVEIARKTGLGRGEVELHMGLHARNVL